MLEALDATPRRAAAAFQGLPRVLLQWMPAPARWSLVELAGHWRDFDREVFLESYRRIATAELPALPDVDPNARALESDCRRVRVSEILRAWRRSRRETVELLASLPPGAWEREGIHPRDGRLSLRTLVERQIRTHDLVHLREIAGIQERYSILGRLGEAPREVRRLVEMVPAGRIGARPEPTRWSLLEHVCHLRDRDTFVIERLAKIARDERPLLREMDGAALALRARYSDQEATEALREWERRRDLLARLLHAFEPAVWQRRGFHPRNGETSIAEVVAHHLDHDAVHLARIRALHAAIVPHPALVPSAHG